MKDQLSEREQQLIEAEEKLRLREEKLLLSERVHATVVQATTDASRRANQAQQQAGGRKRKTTLTREFLRAVGRKAKDKDVKIEKSQISVPLDGSFVHVQHVGEKGEGKEGQEVFVDSAALPTTGAAAPVAPVVPVAPVAPSTTTMNRVETLSSKVTPTVSISPLGTHAAGDEATSLISAAARASHSVRHNSPSLTRRSATAVAIKSAPSILARIATPLGISFRKEAGKYVVTKVRPGGNAELTGRVVPGMVIVSINGHGVRGMEKAGIVHLIKSGPDDGDCAVELQIGRAGTYCS